MKNYKNFVEQLSKLKEEEKKIKELYLEEFVNDIESYLLKCGAIIEEVDPKTLNIREKDSYGLYSTIEKKDKVKIYWMYEKEVGYYLNLLDYHIQIQLYEIISQEKSNKKRFHCIAELSPTKKGTQKDVEKIVKISINKIIGKDMKKFNL